MSGQSSGGCGFLMSVVVHGDSALNDQEKELNQRLRRLYPAVNETETPLPRSWSPKDKFSYIGLSQNNLRVHYKGNDTKTNAAFKALLLLSSPSSNANVSLAWQLADQPSKLTVGAKNKLDQISWTVINSRMETNVS